MIAEADLPAQGQGLLVFDRKSGRWLLAGRELHCGDSFQINWNGTWIEVRIELAASRWYLIGPEKFSLFLGVGRKMPLQARWSP